MSFGGTANRRSSRRMRGPGIGARHFGLLQRATLAQVRWLICRIANGKRSSSPTAIVPRQRAEALLALDECSLSGPHSAAQTVSLVRGGAVVTEAAGDAWQHDPPYCSAHAHDRRGQETTCLERRLAAVESGGAATFPALCIHGRHRQPCGPLSQGRPHAPEIDPCEDRWRATPCTARTAPPLERIFLRASSRSPKSEPESSQQPGAKWISRRGR
jgi:hypothetical protein